MPGLQNTAANWSILIADGCPLWSISLIVVRIFLGILILSLKKRRPNLGVDMISVWTVWIEYVFGLILLEGGNGTQNFHNPRRLVHEHRKVKIEILLCSFDCLLCMFVLVDGFMFSEFLKCVCRSFRLSDVAHLTLII